jgi:Zn finger protein HypA/HybF involved in hydrogenase expression
MEEKENKKILLYRKCYWCDNIYIFDGIEYECPNCGSDDTGIYDIDGDEGDY